MKVKTYRPYIEDPTGRFKTRTQKIAKSSGMRIDRIQAKIYETGLAAFEKQLAAEAGK
jgi:hypothetical protein